MGVMQCVDERESQCFDRSALSLSLSGKLARTHTANTMDTKDQDGWHSYVAVVVISWQIRGFVGAEVHSWNKLEKLRRCISRVHFAKIHLKHRMSAMFSWE